MKGIILTPDIAKIFHPTPDNEGKKCLIPHIQNLTPRLDTQLQKDMTVRYEKIE